MEVTGGQIEGLSRLQVHQVQEKARNNSGVVSIELKKLHKKDSSALEKRDDIFTPLHLAAMNGHEETVHFLLSHKCDVNAISKDEKKTALHLAAEAGHDIVVKTLIKAGSDVNATTSTGDTALHAATLGSHVKTVKVLLKQNNIKINQKNKSKDLAVSYALYDEIVELFEKCGRRASSASPSPSPPQSRGRCAASASPSPSPPPERDRNSRKKPSHSSSSSSEKEQTNLPKSVWHRQPERRQGKRKYGVFSILLVCKV